MSLQDRIDFVLDSETINLDNMEILKERIEKIESGEYKVIMIGEEDEQVPINFEIKAK